MNRTVWILCALSAAFAPAYATSARATEAKSTATATIRIQPAPQPAGKTAPGDQGAATAPGAPASAAPGTAAISATATAAGTAAPLKYPETRRGDVVDDYFGTKVADPYRWLEDADAPETRAWIDAQNAVTFGYLETIPERTRIRERLTKLWNYPKYGVPTREGDWYVYTKNQGLQNQSVTYKQRSLDGEPSVLIDPNLLSKDGTVALSTTSSEFTNDGRFYAYATSKAGSDWMEYNVREVASGNDLPDHLQYIKFSEASWTGDGKGFFYGRYPKPEGNALTSTNRDQKIYYHALGTDQEKDRLIYE